jgi:hypothetical protein
MMRTVQIATLLAAAACGQLPAASDATHDELTVVANLGPQSFTHGSVAQVSQQLAYAFSGNAGEVVAPDVWPTVSAAVNPLHPTLTLLGPRINGHRTVVARSSARGSDANHQAIDGFKLPETGSYLAVVASSGGTGEFTLRFWAQSSHAPRQENMQVSLQLRPSAATQQVVLAHGSAATAASWQDAEVDAIVASMGRQRDAIVALSDAQLLLSSLVAAGSDGRATEAQLTRARRAAAALIGTPAKFAALGANPQAFALWWLGDLQQLVFDSAEVAAPAAVGAKVGALVSAWNGSSEDAGSRHVRAKTLNGAVYGYVVDWSATQADLDGKAVWSWWAREWFDASAGWLGEQTQGATEPDDDGRAP